MTKSFKYYENKDNNGDNVLKGTGWIPDEFDRRDFTPDSPAVKATFKNFKLWEVSNKIDLREYCSPIEDQGDLGSCTAHAIIGAMEYLEKFQEGTSQDYSRLFQYYVTRRKIEGNVGDTGATIRGSIKAVVEYGAAPETCWPYNTWRYDIDPAVECYRAATKYQALTYVSLRGIDEIKTTLFHNIPVAIGFTVFDNLEYGPEVPLPFGATEIGGHAVLLVGYDDDIVIDGEVGAFIFRNSWGKDWGDDGYGYLPYWYFKNDCAEDFWAILTREFLVEQELSFWDKLKNFVEVVKSWFYQLF